MKERVLVIVPTYNEMENIAQIIKSVFSVAPEANILVVDDNSQDGTGKYVEELSKTDSRVKALHRSGKLGLGSAYRDGFRYAIGERYDYIFEMDADFSHNPKDIPRFLKEIENCDLVVGSRYLREMTIVNWPLARLILSYLANIYARMMTRIPVKDMTSGFKCYRLRLLKELPLSRIHSDGYGFQIETVFWAYHKRFKVHEIPIIFTDRSEGSSKMSEGIIWEAFWLVCKLSIVKS
jgi:dolichol-phosphate mannosyltransferase